MSLMKRDQHVIWHPYTQAKTAAPIIPIVKGEGVYLVDENGNKFIDAVSSWWVNIHGHSHPYIAYKVSEQLRSLEHCIFAGFTHEPAIELAEGILNVLPGNFSKVFYSDNGSTAVEVAIKLAIQYWQNIGYKKNKLLVFENAYHGDTFGAMSVSARSAFTNAFNDLLFEVIPVPLPEPGNEQAATDAFKRALATHKNAIAAFIFEPLVLGAGGMLMYEAAALNEMMKICKENNILTLADEVMTGFGRTGKLFACHYLTQTPDIVCLSKAITGGTMALGATVCTEEIYKAFYSTQKDKTFFHGHSYTANPLACAAGNASLELLLQPSTLANIGRIEKQHLAFCEKLKQVSRVEKVRCKGTILAFDVKTEEQTSYFNSQRDNFYNYFLKKGIILRPLGNTLYIIPPYCISADELQAVYKAIDGFLTEK